MHIINPSRDRQVHISEMTKTQLAKIVNDQSARIRQLDEWMKATGRLLIAIALEPEAFKFDGREVTIDTAAVEKVKKGTTLKVDHRGGVVVLTAARPAEQPQVEIPQIIVPPGVH